MGERPPQGESKVELNTLKSEHLAEGFYPIMACIGTREEYGEELDAIEDIEAVGSDANFSAHPDLLKRQGFENAGHGTYVISSIDSKPKFTKDLLNCTSLIAVGREKGTGKEISFLTHQNPANYLRAKKEEFSKHIAERLAELKERCEPGSVDVVIAGGNVNFEMRNYLEDYIEGVKKLGGAVKDTFGFNPTVISGPKALNRDAVYFDTEKRRLYVTRPDDVELHNGPFMSDKVDEMAEKWEQDRQAGEAQK